MIDVRSVLEQFVKASETVNTRRLANIILRLTGSSVLLVLLIAEDTSLISSIMVVKSLLMSVRRSETRSAVLYLEKGQ